MLLLWYGSHMLALHSWHLFACVKLLGKMLHLICVSMLYIFWCSQKSANVIQGTIFGWPLETMQKKGSVSKWKIFLLCRPWDVLLVLTISTVIISPMLLIKMLRKIRCKTNEHTQTRCDVDNHCVHHDWNHKINSKIFRLKVIKYPIALTIPVVFTSSMFT